MSGIANFLPTSIALSSDSSIGNILSDVPLFCEGIMGIGIFTFLFLVKRIRMLSIFLYGSTFLAFTAATLDLAQTLARGPREGDSDINLSTVWGVLYARELLFAFSFGLLNLFFWKLVACRPVEEISLSNVDSKPQSQQEHSANWHRWGLVGMFLKWASLAATLSIPLLQILWRLLPNQRQYGSIYIASTTIETVLAAVFALKLVLNVCISPQEWWFALRSCVVPMFALAVQIGLGIGNLTEFAFTESTLGRLLRGIEVYFLILHDLHATFRVHGIVPRSREKTSQSSEFQIKSRKSTILPISSLDLDFGTKDTGTGLKPARQIDNSPRTSRFSEIFPHRASRLTILQGQPLASPVPTTKVDEDSEHILVPRLSGYQQSASFLVLGSPTDLLASSRTALEGSPISSQLETGYDTSQPGKVDAVFQAGLETEQNDDFTNFKYPVSDSASSLSQQRDSIQYILQQQAELDQSIVELALAPQANIGSSTAQNSKTRSTANSNKSASTSHQSDFSLSVFPVPPDLSKDTDAPSKSLDVAREEIGVTIESIVISPDGNAFSQDKATGISDDSMSGKHIDLDPAQASLVDSTARLSEQFRGTKGTSAETGPASALRPMLLPSMVPTPRQDAGMVTGMPSERSGEGQKPGFPLHSLRPLLLGRPTAVAPPLPATKVPLAQRRQRGGTISSNTRRPVISGPFWSEQRTEAAPGAFERPRPPPLRSES